MLQEDRKQDGDAPEVNFSDPDVNINSLHNRVQPHNIIHNRAIRICNHLEYRSHTKPTFLKPNTLTIADLVKFKSMVLMYNIYITT